MDEIFIAQSQRLAGYFMLNGFILQGMRADKNKTGRNIFIFKNSDELQKAFNQYKKIYSK